MFEFIDTPNPNAKKIILNHNYEIAVYLNTEIISDDNVLKIFNHPSIENILLYSVFSASVNFPRT